MLTDDKKELFNKINQTEAERLEAEAAIDVSETYTDFKGNYTCKNFTDLSEFLDEFFDFNILRAEMYFPRARLYDLPERIAREQHARQLMTTELSTKEQAALEDNIYLKFFTETNNFPRGIKDNWKESVEEVFKDDQKLADKLKLPKAWENDFELENFIRLLNKENDQARYEEMKASVEAGKKISINHYQWQLIEQGEPKAYLDDILSTREDEGFMMAHIFWFMLRAQMYHKDEVIKGTNSRIASTAVMEAYAHEFLSHILLPGTLEKPKIDNNYFPDIKRKLWPSAHLWAALHSFDRTNTGHLREDPGTYLEFIKRADALYKLAVQHDVYKKIKPTDFDKDVVLAYDGLIAKPVRLAV